MQRPREIVNRRLFKIGGAVGVTIPVAWLRSQHITAGEDITLIVMRDRVTIRPKSGRRSFTRVWPLPRPKRGGRNEGNLGGAGR